MTTTPEEDSPRPRGRWRHALERAFARATAITAWCGVVAFGDVGLLEHGHFPVDGAVALAVLGSLYGLLMGVELGQAVLEERARPVRRAVAIALGWWALLAVGFVAAPFFAVYTVAVVRNLELTAGLHAVAGGVDYVVQQGRAGDAAIWPGITGATWRPRSEIGIYVGRVPALLIPPLVAWTTSRLTRSALAHPARHALAIAVSVVAFGAHVVVADRFPPFTFRRPGFDGARRRRGSVPLRRRDRDRLLAGDPRGRRRRRPRARAA